MPAQNYSRTRMIPMSVAPDSTGQQDLGTYLRIFWRWRFLLLAFVVLIPLAVFLIEQSKPKVYESSTLVELQDVSAEPQGTTGGPIVTGNLDAVAQLVTTTSVADIAGRLLHQPPGPLLSKVSASATRTRASSRSARRIMIRNRPPPSRTPSPPHWPIARRTRRPPRSTNR